MTTLASRLAFTGETMFPPCPPFFSRAWGTGRLMPGKPPGSPGPPPLVRFADKALRAFPTLLPAHRPTGVG